MKALELCAGYGGLSLAMEWLHGWETPYVAEIHEGANKVLAARFPSAVNIGDIRVNQWSDFIGEVDAILAGFPCQDISSAGTRKGISGERSGVWRYVAEAIRVIRPRIVFLENVAAIRFRNRGLDTVLGDLAEARYDARWTCIRASDVGAPHHRERWFCLAYPADADHEGRRPVERAESEVGSRHDSYRRGEVDAVSGGERAERRGVSGVLASQASTALGRGYPPIGSASGHRSADAAYASSPGRAEGQPEPAQQPGSVRRSSVSGGEPAADAPGWGWVGGSWRPGEAPGIREPSHSGTSPGEWWGDYLAAIRRWEYLTGRPAPAPTELGPRGGQRVAAAFSEWMMGLPPGWVTAVPGLNLDSKGRDRGAGRTRNQALHIIGNGVVPQQAMEAYSRLERSWDV